MPNAKKKGVFFAVLVLFAINILNFYDRHVPGALVEPMRREFHLSDMQIGLLGSVFIWLYAIMGVPLGRIADSGSRKKLLAWGLVVWASLTACAAIATNPQDRKSTRLNSSHGYISYAVFCLKKKKQKHVLSWYRL